MKKLPLSIIFSAVLFISSVRAQLDVNIVTINNVLCYGDSSARIFASATGGTGYSYVWSNGLVGDTITDLPIGTYSVTVTSAQMETGSATVSISQPVSVITVTASSTPTSGCSLHDGTAKAIASGGTPGYIYPWSNGQADSAISNLATGFYTVTATDVNGCTASTYVNVNSSAAFTIQTGSTPEDCYGDIIGSAWAQVSDDTFALFYAWSDGETGDTISNLFAGTYMVTVTDVTGCSKAAAVEVAQPAPIMLTTSTTPSACDLTTGSATVTVGGGMDNYSFIWSSGDTSALADSLGSGYYTVAVSTDNCSATASAYVANTNGPVITMPFTSPSCPNGNNSTVRAAVTGGTPPYTYLWTPFGSTDSVLTGLTANSWKVIVTDHHNCTSTNTVNVPQPNYISVSPYIFDPTCNANNNGSITLGVSGGTPPYTYTWFNSQTGPAVAGLGNNNYDVTITDANFCSVSSSIGVISPSPVGLNTSSTKSSGNNGTATASVSGGTTPYAYDWSNGETSPTDSSLAPGQYSITVTDANGCTAFGEVTVTFGVGIASIGASQFNFVLFPNPASGLIRLEVDYPEAVQGDIILTDVSGRAVYTSTRTIATRESFPVDISNLSAGVYFVLINADGRTARQKFVIAR